jgi:hypothetical protein
MSRYNFLFKFLSLNKKALLLHHVSIPHAIEINQLSIKFVQLVEKSNYPPPLLLLVIIQVELRRLTDVVRHRSLFIYSRSVLHLILNFKFTLRFFNSKNFYNLLT